MAIGYILAESMMQQRICPDLSHRGIFEQLYEPEIYLEQIINFE